MKAISILNPFKLVVRMGNKISELLADFQDMAPYHLRLMTDSYAKKGDRFHSDFARREHLIYGWLAMDHAYFGKISSSAARHWILLGDLHSEEHYPASGRRFYEKGAKIMREVRDPGDPWLLEALNKLAHCYEGCVKHEAALELYREIVDTQNVAETSREDRLAALIDLKNCMKHLELFSDAAAVLENAIDVLEEDGMPDSTDSIAYYRELATLLEAAGDKENAAIFGVIAESLDWFMIMIKSCGRDSRLLVEELTKLRNAYNRRKKIEIVSVLDDLLELIRLKEKVKGPDNPGLVRDLKRLADLYEKRDEGGDKTVAFHHRKRAKRIEDEVKYG